MNNAFLTNVTLSTMPYKTEVTLRMACVSLFIVMGSLYKPVWQVDGCIYSLFMSVYFVTRRYQVVINWYFMIYTNKDLPL